MVAVLPSVRVMERSGPDPRCRDVRQAEGTRPRAAPSTGRPGARLGLPGGGMPIQSAAPGPVVAAPGRGRRPFKGRTRIQSCRRDGFCRRVVLAALAVLLAPAGRVRRLGPWTDNFGALEPGRVYRSGQMPAGDLAATVRGRRIRTVLNLRGVEPGQGVVPGRARGDDRRGATQVDVSMSSCEWMSRVQLRTVVRVLDACEYPLLDPLPVGVGTDRVGLGRRHPAPPRRDARRREAAVLARLPVRPGRRRQGDGRAPRPVRGLAPRPGLVAHPRAVPPLGRRGLPPRHARPRTVALRPLPARRHHPPRGRPRAGRRRRPRRALKR